MLLLQFVLAWHISLPFFEDLEVSFNWPELGKKRKRKYFYQRNLKQVSYTVI